MRRIIEESEWVLMETIRTARESDLAGQLCAAQSEKRVVERERDDLRERLRIEKDSGVRQRAQEVTLREALAGAETYKKMYDNTSAEARKHQNEAATVTKTLKSVLLYCKEQGFAIPEFLT